MKIARMISRYLLGLVFLVFGLNGLLHFLPSPPPTGLVAQFTTLMVGTHYMVLVFLLQTIGGALLLANRYVPLALVLLAPIVVNILLFHTFISPEGLPMAVVCALLWVVIFSGVKHAFQGIFQARV